MQFSEDRQRRHDKGTIGEDYIIEMFKVECGVGFDSHRAKANQWLHGENSFGIEFKFDIQSEKYPNLYIEGWRKNDSSDSEYWKSSLLKDDGSWLWCQFNRNECWLFMKENLKKLYEHREKLGYREIVSGTSKGFLLPKNEIENNLRIYCKHMIFSEEAKRMVRRRVTMGVLCER